MNSVTLLGRLPNGKCARNASHTLQLALALPGQTAPLMAQCPRLPAETLREIFLYCMVGGIGDLNPANAPLVLRRVNTAWKVVTDSTPCLWSTIAITPPQFLRSNVQAIKEWLERAGTTNLLNISVSVPPGFPDLSLLLAVLAEFMPFSRRWQRMDLSIPVEFLPLLLSNPGAPLPALESLTLAMGRQPNFTIDSSARRLRSVSLLALPPMGLIDGTQLNLGWKQITHLNIGTVTGTLDVLWDIFFQCPQLLSLTISALNNCSIPKIPFHRNHLYHSNIRQLTMFVNAHPGAIGDFLDGLYLHNLQELQLNFTDPADEVCIWPKTAILDLRQRCLPPLAKIVIAGKFIFEEDLVDFVKNMKHLEQLEITYEEHKLVTPYVRDLMPRSDTAVLQRQAAYWDEVYEVIFNQNQICTWHVCANHNIVYNLLISRSLQI